MCDVLIVGAGPLPGGSTDITCSYNLRTCKFAAWLRSTGLDARIVAVDLFRTCENPAGETRNSYVGEYTLLPNSQAADRALAALIQEIEPRCVLALSYQAADLACRVPHRLPLWCDLPGWIMAEAQLTAAQRHDDSGVESFARHEQRILRRADKVSAVSHNQRLATLGELAAIGRLNRRNMGYELVHYLPSLAFDWRPLMGQTGRTLHDPAATIGIDRNAFILLWSGSYNVWTDVERLFALTDGVLSQLPHAHYVSTGGNIPGYNDDLCARFASLVSSSPFRSRYHLLPWIPFPEVLDWFRRASMGLSIDGDNLEIVFGSRTRLVDMLSHGLAAASTTGTELAADLASGDAIIALDPSRPQSWAGTILDSCSDPGAVEDLANRARRFVFERYALPVVGSDLLEWIRTPKAAPDNFFLNSILVDGLRAGLPVAGRTNPFWQSHPLVTWQPQEPIENAARRSLDPYPPGRISRQLQKVLARLLHNRLAALPVLSVWRAGARLVAPHKAARWQGRIDPWATSNGHAELARKLVDSTGREVYRRALEAAGGLCEVKALNVLLARHEYGRRGELCCRPQRIEIEPSSACNIRCHMCARNTMRTAPTLMSQEIFYKITPFLRTAALFEIVGAGEPTLNPHLTEFIDTASRLDCYVRMFTNGTGLTPELCARLVQMQVGSVVLSLPAADGEVYKHVTCADRFQEVVENMRTLRDVKHVFSSRFPRLRINCALTASALRTAPEAVRLAAELGCEDVSLGIACIFDPELEPESLLKADWNVVRSVFCRCLELGQELGVRVTVPQTGSAQCHADGESAALTTELANPPNDSQLAKTPHGCLLPWQSLLVRADGSVEACVYNRRIVGNLKTQTIESIWNGMEFRRFREGTVTYNGVNYCARCYHLAARSGCVGPKSHLPFDATRDGY